MNPLRTLRQWLGDSELSALAREIERLQDTLEAAGGKAELLMGRFERLQNRLGMRVTRLETSKDRDDKILEDIERQARARRRNGGDDDDDWGQPPDWR